MKMKNLSKNKPISASFAGLIRLVLGLVLASSAWAKQADSQVGHRVVPANPLTVIQDPLIVSPASNVAFGAAVAMDGDRLAVGAEMGVYVYKNVNGQWVKEARLNNGRDDYFVARDVSISGDRIAYGEGGNEFEEVYNNGNGIGSINIYKLTAGSRWEKETEIFDDSGDGWGFDFGYSVSIDGTEMVAGGTDYLTTSRVIFYSYESNKWIRKQHLDMKNFLPFRFGVINKILLKEGYLFVSEPKYYNDPLVASSLKIFRKEGSEWIFDSSLSIECESCFSYSDGLLVIDRSVYARSGNTWTLNSMLPFGRGSIAIKENTITYASGHIYERENSLWVQKNPIPGLNGSIAASVKGLVQSRVGQINPRLDAEFIAYEKNDSGWIQSQRVVSENNDNFARFGKSISMLGEKAIVGESYDYRFGGAAYILNRSSEGWSIESKLVPIPPAGIRSREFGSAVALSADYAVVDTGITYCGYDFSGDDDAVYIFKKENGQWIQDARLIDSDSKNCRGSFGASISISGKILLVSAYEGAYLYERTSSSWVKRTLIDAAQLGFKLGFLYSIDAQIVGDTIAIASFGMDSKTGLNRSSISFFQIASGKLQFLQRIDFPKPVSFSLSSTTMAALSDSEVKLFGRAGNTWTLLSMLTEAVEPPEKFVSVKISGGVLAVGTSSGAVDLYIRNGANWVRKAELVGNRSPRPRSLAPIAISGETVLVGDPEFSDYAYQGGAVRVFRVASDYGDAPDSYKTLRINGGARHFIDGPRLGSRIDADEDGHPSPGATGDDIADSDDEDGVTFSALVAGSQGTLQVVVSNGPAKLDAWIDFDGDGTFTASERIANAVAVTNGGSQLPFAVPAASRIGQTYARVRVSKDGAAGPNATVVDGEVEDELVSIRTLAAGISDASVVEGNAGTRQISFEVTTNAPPAAIARVNYATVDGTAVAGTDYIRQSGTLNFGIGETRKVINIVVNGDLSAEADEKFQVVLSSPTGITLDRSVGVGTITDDDSAAGTPGISVNVMRFNFGNVAVGATSAVRTLIVTSTGSAPLEIKSIRIAGDYSGTSRCPKLLAPGATCELTGSFAPKARGTRAGSVTLTTNAPSGLTVVELMGTGI